MEHAELQFRLVQAVYRRERVRQRGAALDALRARCETLLDETALTMAGTPRLQALLRQIRFELAR